MSNYGRFLSGKQRDLGIGISNYSEGKTVLNVIGNVAIGGSIGIGTTSRFDLTADVDTRTIRVREELYDTTGSSGINNQLLISVGGTSVKWSSFEDVSSFQGITVQDEGIVVGGALSTRTVNFVGSGVTASASGSIATITVNQVVAAGFDGQLQYNNNGDFGGAQNFYYNDSTLRVGIGTSSMNRTLQIVGDVGISSNIYASRALVDVDNIIPLAPEELATKSYVDNFTTAGLTVQKAVSAATTTSINAYYNNVTAPPDGIGAKLWGVGVGTGIIDGYIPTIGDRVLIKDQGVGFGSTAQNGYYTVARVGNISTSFEYIRATDFDESTEITAGAFSFVIGGDVNSGGGFVLVTKGIVSIGVSSIEFTQFSSPGEIIAGDGLVKTGNVIDAVSASTSRIVMNPDSIDLATVATSRSNLTSGTGSFISGLSVDAYGRVSGVITSNTHTLATSSVKGIASFDTPAFAVTSGAVGLASTSAGGAAVLFVDGTANQINVTRSGGTEIVGLTPNVTISGTLTANSFVGNGSGLTGLSAGVGVATAGVYVGSGATVLNFTGAGVSSVTLVGTTATINIPGGRDIDTIGNANQVLYKNSLNKAVGSANLTFSGTNLVCGGTVTANSDESLKENIKTIDDGLNKVLNLRGVEFDYKSDKVHSIGLIAQEVEKVIPELVYTNDDGIKSVAYQNIVAVLIEAVKSQQSQIDSLANEIRALKGLSSLD
jgi:hypothetical protein